MGRGGAVEVGRPAVELRNVSFAYGRRTILSDVSLAFAAGEVSALLGPNGCGKSTTVRLVSRALVPSAGEVLIGGRNVAELGRKELARHVAVLAQGTQVPSMQVEQLVMSGRYPHRSMLAAPTPADRRAVWEAMERAGCARHAALDVARLSGGERQRVYLAMVLAQQADVVVMDEPTTYLDAGACFDLMDVARELADDGIAVVMVLHDLCLALSSCDRVAVLSSGRVEAAGTPDELAAGDVIDRVFGVHVRKVELPGEGYKPCYCLLPRG